MIEHSTLLEKEVIITGGASGIGLSAVLELSKRFKQVHVLDITEPVVELRENVIYYDCDVSNATQLQMIAEQLAGRDLYGLFCCAGILESNRLEETSLERMQQVVNVNLLGTLYTLKFLLPLLQQQVMSNVLLMGSDQSFVGKEKNSVYGCTKAAVAQLAKSMAMENAEFNMRVNCICPGTVDTPLYRAAIQRASKNTGISQENIMQELAAEQPLKRIAQSREIVAFIAFLLSEESSYINGAALPIDGGYTAQ